MGGSLIRKVRSAYLRDEIRYDRWGALGKVLATLEAFRMEGIPVDARWLDSFVNAAFPRTFSRQRTPAAGESLPPRGELRSEYDRMLQLLRASGVPEVKAGELAVEEVGERRCLDVGVLKDYLR